ncbi:DUF6310 domain-containing protein [Stigmatella hybrida]|uniref:DUF6310 domain-containing protein n=1 Tax=Stigmatella hybrida TaxID=394097 RepID=UPI00295E292F|nr:DUF6310 domain-containing protein [Stigmatella hybrida]
MVQEASHPWPVLVDRCFQELDREKVRFRDPTRRCAVASAGAAAVGIGVCILAAPEIVVGAVILTGAVVVAVAIQEALDTHELSGVRPDDERPVLQTEPSSTAALPKRRPKPQPSGQNWPPLPPSSVERERNPKCTPQRVPHLGGDELHNTCADRVPQNSFPGWDVLVNGKRFDALQLTTRTLWEVKTTDIETYNAYIQRIELGKQVAEGLRERELAEACGYQFVIGVRTQEHKDMLESLTPDLIIVLMPWC